MINSLTSAQVETICFVKEQFKEDGHIFTSTVADLVAEDFNGDSRPDIVSIVYEDIELWVNVDGYFPAHVELVAGLVAGTRMSAADLENDRDLDIVFTEMGDPGITVGQVSILINDGTGNFTHEVIDPYYIGAQAVSIVDLDRDGDQDIVVTGVYQFGLVWCDTSWYENTGNLHFTKHVFDSYLQGASDLDVGDVDGDGDYDILWGDVSAYRFCWFENDGNQNFTLQPIDIDQDNIKFCSLIDLNQNSSLDILLTTEDPEELLFLENDGNQNFTSNLICSGYEYPKRPSAVDLDADGDIDIINAYYSEEHDFVWWENDGEEHFTLRIIEPFFNQTCSHRTADINNDGRLDVIAGNGRGGLAWWENQPHIGVDLSMPAHHFRPGNTCSLNASVFNHTPDDLGELPMFILMEYTGQFWFYPAWTEEIQFEWVNVTTGFQEMPIVDPFTWPEGAGSGSGLYFYGLFTKPDLSKLYGVIDWWNVSWSE